MSTWTLVGTLPGGGGAPAGLNFRGNVTPALLLAAAATLRAGQVRSGLLVAQAPATLRPTTTAPGLAVAPLVTGSTRPAQTPALAVAPVAAVQAARQTPALDLQRVTYDLSATRGAATATNAGGNAFTNPTNAQGPANGTLASGAGNALGARTYRLDLAYPGFVGKDDLTITAAQLRFYISQTGTALNNGGMTIGWGSASRPYAQTNAFPADVNHLTTPLLVPVTGVPLTWAEMASVVARVNHVTAALNTSTANVDAVELVVTATRTDNL